MNRSCGNVREKLHREAGAIEKPPRSQHRQRRDETPRHAPRRLRCAARGFRAGGRTPPRLSGNPPDGARHLRSAVQDPGTRRRPAARDRPQAARGHGRRDAAAGAVHRRRLHRAPDDRRSGGLAGQAIAIDGLSATSTDVLVRIESLGGATQTERLSPARTTFIVKSAPGAAEVAVTYLRLGTEHILLVFDHLLFVLALVILVRGWRRVALTVTAFTVAHSITLATATLGLVNVPGPPVEAAIALS